ncbi:sigma-54-dependent transcriptional regulator [Mesoaciditoga sp.]
MNTILFVDDEEHILDLMKMHFSKKYNVLIAKNGIDALAQMEHGEVDLIITDVKMPRMDGMTLLKKVKERFDVPVILVTAFGSIENAVDAIKMGAYDYISKPVNLKDLEVKIERALEYFSIKRENLELKTRIKSFSTAGIVTANEKMMKILNKIPEYAQKDLPVLILGESGTGKELIAKEIHAQSHRYLEPFIAVNVSAIPEDLFESEFFGYEKGAFTGANGQKIGKFEAANHGTLFLDEIGDMRLDHQAKLLRVLQDSKITRLGSVKEIPLDFRLICATNKPLSEMIKDGTFRQDLYYRINVIRIEIPPLRERPEDVEAIAKYYLKMYSEKFSEREKVLSSKALNVLKSYSWPGNVRELENVILRAMINSSEDEIKVRDLPDEVIGEQEYMDYQTFLVKKKVEKEKLYRELQRKFVKQLLRRSKGNVSRAAELANMDRRLLQNMIKETKNWQS